MYFRPHTYISVKYDRFPYLEGWLTSFIKTFFLGLGEHGSAWYVNGDLAPDLYLLKGTEYTFIVEVMRLHYEGYDGGRGP